MRLIEIKTESKSKREKEREGNKEIKSISKYESNIYIEI